VLALGLAQEQVQELEQVLELEVVAACS